MRVGEVEREGGEEAEMRGDPVETNEVQCRRSSSSVRFPTSSEYSS